MEDYYIILGVPKNASESDIKSAFRQLAKQHHPDSQNGRESPAEAEQRFFKITEAYQILSHAERRAEYDRAYHDAKDTAAVRKPARNAKALYREGRRAYKNDQFDKASTLFRSAAEIEPQNPLYCSWLGLSLSRHKGLLHEAKQWCEHAMVLSPLNADYYVNLALVYRNAGIKTLSVKYLRKALSINPAHKRALFWMESVDERKGGKFLEKIKALLRLKR